MVSQMVTQDYHYRNLIMEAKDWGGKVAGMKESNNWQATYEMIKLSFTLFTIYSEQ